MTLTSAHGIELAGVGRGTPAGFGGPCGVHRAVAGTVLSPARFRLRP